MFKDHVVDLGKLYIAASGARSSSLSFRASRLSKLLAYDQIELPNKFARVRTGSKAASQLQRPVSGFGAFLSLPDAPAKVPTPSDLPTFVVSRTATYALASRLRAAA